MEDYEWEDDSEYDTYCCCCCAGECGGADEEGHW